MTVLHLHRAGAIAPTLLPFPRQESRDDADLPELAKLFGKVYDMHDGISATLVRALVLIPKQAIDASYCLTFEGAGNPVTREAILTAGGESIAGFTFPGSRAIPAGEVFWMLLPRAGMSRLTVVDDGGAVSTEGVFLIAGAAGTVNEAAQSTVPGVTVLRANAAIGAGLAGDVSVCAPTVS